MNTVRSKSSKSSAVLKYSILKHQLVKDTRKTSTRSERMSLRELRVIFFAFLFQRNVSVLFLPSFSSLRQNMDTINVDYNRSIMTGSLEGYSDPNQRMNSD